MMAIDLGLRHTSASAGLAEYTLDTTKPIRHPQRATLHKRNQSGGGHSEGHP